MDVIVDRCAGLDVHKKTVMATVRTPDGSGGRATETREFLTFTGRLVKLRDWLMSEGVTQVAMEATGVYWKPVWHVLEDADSFESSLVNPAHFKNLPGRKTDVKDSEWRPSCSSAVCCGARSSRRPGRQATGPDPVSNEDRPGTGAGDPTHPEALGRRRDQVGLGGHRRVGQVVSADARSAHRR